MTYQKLERIGWGHSLTTQTEYEQWMIYGLVKMNKTLFIVEQC